MRKLFGYGLILSLSIFFTACEIQEGIPPRPDRGSARPDLPAEFEAQPDFQKIQLSWMPDSEVEEYLLVRSTSPIDFVPVDGEVYALNEEVKTGVFVVLKGDDTTFEDTDTATKQIYYYTLYASAERLYSSGASAFTKPQMWSAEAYIKAVNAEAGDTFGRIIDIDGDTAVVNSTGEDSNQTTITNGGTASANNSATSAGAVYVYKYNGTGWSQQAYIKPVNMELADLFGQSVAISGDTIVVGSTGEDSNQTTITNGLTASANNASNASGAVYVYKRNADDEWEQQAYIKAANADAGDSFGLTVDIDGNTIVVATYNEDSNQTTITNGATASSDNTLSASGAAYVYKRTGNNWAQEAYIKAANAGANDQYGIAAAISGDTIVIGANLEDSNQTTITNGATASADNTASASGAAYVYKRTGSNWAQEAYLKASNAQSGDVFGVSVAIDGDRIAVGAISEDSNQTTVTNGTTASADNTAGQSGAVYVYKRTGSNWAQEAYLKAANAEANDNFGKGLSISGDRIVVGASGEDSNQSTISNDGTASADNTASQSGAVYVFKRTGSNWAQEAYLKAPNPDASDAFGYGCVISGDKIIAGAVGEDSNQTSIGNGDTASSDNSANNAGAAYIFDL